VSNGNRSKASAVNGCDFATSIHNIDGLLKGFARRPEGAGVAVVAIGSDEDAGAGIGWR
jgi:hypothetical protein